MMYKEHEVTLRPMWRNTPWSETQWDPGSDLAKHIIRRNWNTAWGETHDEVKHNEIQVAKHISPFLTARPPPRPRLGSANDLANLITAWHTVRHTGCSPQYWTLQCHTVSRQTIAHYATRPHCAFYALLKILYSCILLFHITLLPHLCIALRLDFLILGHFATLGNTWILCNTSAMLNAHCSLLREKRFETRFLPSHPHIMAHLYT